MLVDVAASPGNFPRHLIPEPPLSPFPDSFGMSNMFVQPESHFKDVLHTNYSASSAEIGQIRDLLAQPMEELSRINTEIYRLKSTLAYLISQREKLQAFVNSHRALISPLRRLPPEVLSEIFVLCLPHECNPTRNVAEAPLLLTLVCKQWRQVALSTARLWSALHIYLPPRPQKCGKFPELLERRSLGVKAWLSRSGTLPISFSLVIGLSRESRQGHTVYQPILDALFGFRERWVDVMIRVPSAVLTAFEQSVKPEEVPLLRKLTVDYDLASRQLLIDGSQYGIGPQLENRAIPMGKFICEAPALRDLTLLDPIQNVYTLPLNWAKLTHFKSETVLGSLHNPREVLDVLIQGAPNLRSVNITANFRPPYVPMTEPKKPVTLPFLHTLHLRLQFDVSPPPFGGIVHHVPGTQQVNTYGAQVEGIFAGFLAPKLQTLCIRFSNIVDQPGVHIPTTVPFLKFLILSQCPLRTLDLNFVTSTKALIECLEAVPMLKNLCVDECLWTILRDRQRAAALAQAAAVTTTAEEKNRLSLLTDELLDRLTPSPDNPAPLCPELERINLTRCNETITEAKLAKYVMSRFNGQDVTGRVIKPLRALNVAFQLEKINISVEDQQSRREMKNMKKVMEVSISYPKPNLPPDLPNAGQQLESSRRYPFLGIDGV
ncbi:hypothetical protein VNI00_010002 [Paramarasmius palmivorus]|uniref:F-box domain-containing protein n=1 Tax=Paramarasmius palmivorus TaxID=297713 RepID=A0AAW0CKN7_9AGAR